MGNVGLGKDPKWKGNMSLIKDLRMIWKYGFRKGSKI